MQRKIRGITRFELLVLLTALSLLVAAGGSLQQGNAQLTLAQACANHLRRIGQLSVVVATFDNRMIPHRESSAGIDNWEGLGEYDWGGANGACGESRDDWPSYPSLGASTRPYNRALFGDIIPPNADFGIFRCPGDTGQVVNANYGLYYFDPAPCSQTDLLKTLLGPVFDAYGTSYSGDFLGYSGVFPEGDDRYRFGTFMRPYDMIPNAAETLLFYDFRLAQAFLSSQEWTEAVWGEPMHVPSWHPPNDTSNALMVDGHVQPIKLTVSGSMMVYVNFDGAPSPRGPNWHYDAFPEEPVIEQYFDDPVRSGDQSGDHRLANGMRVSTHPVPTSSRRAR